MGVLMKERVNIMKNVYTKEVVRWVRLTDLPLSCALEDPVTRTCKDDELYIPCMPWNDIPHPRSSLVRHFSSETSIKYKTTNTLFGTASSGCQVRSLVTDFIHIASQIPLMPSGRTRFIMHVPQLNKELTSQSRYVRSVEGKEPRWRDKGDASCHS